MNCNKCKKQIKNPYLLFPNWFIYSFIILISIALNKLNYGIILCAIYNWAYGYVKYEY